MKKRPKRKKKNEQDSDSDLDLGHCTEWSASAEEIDAKTPSPSASLPAGDKKINVGSSTSPDVIRPDTIEQTTTRDTLNQATCSAGIPISEAKTDQTTERTLDPMGSYVVIKPEDQAFSFRKINVFWPSKQLEGMGMLDTDVRYGKLAQQNFI